MKKGEVVGSRRFGKNITKDRKTYKQLFEEFYNQLKIRERGTNTYKLEVSFPRIKMYEFIQASDLAFR